MIKCRHPGLIQDIDKYELPAISARLQIPERLCARYPVGINADMENPATKKIMLIQKNLIFILCTPLAL
jgi:hypothetical protein